MRPTVRSLLGLAALVCACRVESSRPPLRSADPRVNIDDATGLVTLDATVPTSAAGCTAGQMLRKGESGWECWTPPVYSEPEHAHEAAQVTDFAPSARAAMGARSDDNPLHHDRYTDGEAMGARGARADANPLHHGRYTDDEAVAARGARADANPLHHDRYLDAEAVAAATGAGVPWSSVTGRPAAWPGTVAWSSVGAAPAAYPPAPHGHSLAELADVTADKAWPGRLPWTGVTGAPATCAPATHAHAWGDVTGVDAATAWPGTFPWAGVTGAPADLATLAAEVATLKQQLITATTTTLLRGAKAGAKHGECLVVTHGWNTHAVGYTAWTTTAEGAWQQVQPGFEPGHANLALARPASASSSVSGTSPGMAVDGNSGVQWVADNVRSGWVQVDLGAVRPISSVRVVPTDRQSNAGSYSSTSWEILLSADGVTFAAAAAGACAVGVNCASEFAHTLPAGASARHVRFNAKACAWVPSYGGCSVTLAELSVFAAQHTVSQPDANSVKLCNYAGAPTDPATRDLALLLWR